MLFCLNSLLFSEEEEEEEQLRLDAGCEIEE